jgi:FixJ family two-component response regulator
MDGNVVCVVDDDRDLNTMIEWALGKEGFTVHSFNRPESFLEALGNEACGCVLLDLKMPGLSGLEVQQIMKENQVDIPILFLSGQADVPSVTSAFVGGAVDFLEKPIDVRTLVEKVAHALEISRERREEAGQKTERARLIARLTPREKEILQNISHGLTSKEIEKALAISPRTVEIHRGRIMEKLAIRSIADLVAFSISNGIR